MPSGIYIRNKPGWSKGLTKETDKRIKKHSEKLKEKIPWNKGIPCREETKKKLSKANKGQIPWNKGLGTIIKMCSTCGKKFNISKSRYRDNRGKFCSWKCRWDYSLKKSTEYELTQDMAELIGIIMGDGCIYKNTKNIYQITITGNPIEDKYYMEKHIPNLLYKCLNIKKKPFMAKNKGYIIMFSNKSFVLFLKRLGITERKSKTIRIPNEIKRNNNLLKRCIKGIADTDFTLIFTRNHKYPRITASFASDNLVKDLEIALRSMGFTLNSTYNYKQKDKKRNKIWVTNHISLDGPHNLKRWLKLIGFSNHRILSRYELWKKEGFLQPKTTLPERLNKLGWVGGDLYGK